jgi:hypothetical protein
MADRALRFREASCIPRGPCAASEACDGKMSGEWDLNRCDAEDSVRAALRKIETRNAGSCGSNSRDSRCQWPSLASRPERNLFWTARNAISTSELRPQLLPAPTGPSSRICFASMPMSGCNTG